MILSLLAGLFLALCVFAALHDVNRLTIPNWLNLTLALLFVPAAAVSGVPLEIIGGHVIAAACALLIAFIILIRASLPRPRYDQLMTLGWRYLLPLALLNLLITGALSLTFGDAHG